MEQFKNWSDTWNTSPYPSWNFLVKFISTCTVELTGQRTNGDNAVDNIAIIDKDTDHVQIRWHNHSSDSYINGYAIGY